MSKILLAEPSSAKNKSQCLHLLRQSLCERVMHTTLYVDAICTNAGLARTSEVAFNRPINYLVHVRILEYDMTANFTSQVGSDGNAPVQLL